MGIQARNIIRYAKKNKITLDRGNYDTDGKTMCARSVVAKMCGVTDTYDIELPGRAGVTIDDISALEAGFEGEEYHISYARWISPNYDPSLDNLKRNRYYKVGQRVAKMAGITIK